MTAGAATGQAARLGWPLVWVGELGSTNDLARLLVGAGCPEGAVVVADRQTRGRGRQGRAWASPSGGLWCSVLLYPSADLPQGLLSLAVAVAVAETAEQFVPGPARIRWPNDVEIAGRKVAGILIETAGAAVVVGVGINVGIELQVMPPEVAARAGSLHLIAGRPIERRAVLEALLARLADRYSAWAAGGEAVSDAWSSRDMLRGTPVAVLHSGPAIEGIAEGINREGALRIRTATGAIRQVVAGDVHQICGPSDPSG
ncbi:MAG: biotin--[acetyl-CoA-carboxylase] ligase [bacterium]|nr:biotin--[acetyl-CoA-carboxylase] ligase [bacterium]